MLTVTFSFHKVILKAASVPKFQPFNRREHTAQTHYMWPKSFSDYGNASKYNLNPLGLRTILSCYELGTIFSASYARARRSRWKAAGLCDNCQSVSRLRVTMN